MKDSPVSQTFYGDLAPWWPLLSPVEDYAEEAAWYGALFDAHDQPVSTLLELGSGGGHNAAHLAPRFALTLVDLSEAMLEQSRRLNPGCEHVAADMRHVRLGREFDGVFIHDAIDYMTTEAELRAALQTAFAHLRPGGLAVIVPDSTTETWAPSEDVFGGDDGQRSARVLEWTFDPDPSDTWVQTEYVFALRTPEHPETQVVHETHRIGLFPRETWLRVLEEVGFYARRIVEETEEERAPRDVFLAVKPM
jgi:SAM-dependent methyltransferase